MVYKRIIAYLLLLLFFTQKTFCSENLDLKTIDKNQIIFKEQYFEKIFSKKEITKKVFYIGVGLGTIAGTSYIGYKYWKKHTENSQPEETPEKPITTTNRNKSSDDSNKKLLFDVFIHGIYKGVKLSAISLVLLTSTTSFNFIKDHAIDIFTSKDIGFFIKTSRNTQSSLDLLKELFELETEQFFKEEVIGNFNYFVENLESLIALTNVLARQKIKNLSNFQILKNTQELVIKKYFSFFKELKTTINVNSSEYFKESDAKKSLPGFEELNNQIIRFIRLASSLIYEV